ncbi:MAG TPA: tetratricopeptide repeat protein, partial [Roseiflexaceae bacterium]|nr:tetratricopeptide repeat protein [Roseiflexaceae bacterium]
LGVFVGGCHLDAAEAVCSNLELGAGSLGSAATPPIPILDVLSSLVDKSLLRQTESSGGEPRFSMLETIRDYATERLIASDEYDLLRQAHAQYFLALAERAEAELTGPRQAEWLERLEAEHDNLRAALGWSREQNSAEIALRLTGALWRFWYTRGYLSEGRRWLAQALAMAENGLPVLRSEADGQPSDQQARASKALQAKVLNGAGGLAYAQGDYMSATSLYEGSLTLRRQINDQEGVATGLNNLGALEYARGDYDRARQFYLESLELFRTLGNRTNVARLLDNLGLVAHEQGDDAQAQIYHEESLALRRVLDDKRGIAVVLTNLGEVLQTQGKSAQAIARYVESLTLRAELGDKEGIAYSLEGLAEVAGSRGQPKRAARLWGAAAALREAIGAPLPPSEQPHYDHNLAAARAQFDAAAFDTAFAAGASMTLEQVAAEAKSLVSVRMPDGEGNQHKTTPLPIDSTPTGPRLMIATPSGMRAIPLDRMPLTIGRESHTDISLDDPRVSRQHARLSYRQQQIWLTDLRSSNGTFINGQAIKESALQSGDVLSFGGVEATFEDPEASTRGLQAAEA